MPEIRVEKYIEDDVSQMVDIWNKVVEECVAFPQEDKLILESGREFFATQTWCGVAKDENGRGMKIGFTPLGTEPGGFRLKDGSYSDICLYYILPGKKD